MQEGKTISSMMNLGIGLDEEFVVAFLSGQQSLEEYFHFFNFLNKGHLDQKRTAKADDDESFVGMICMKFIIIIGPFS